MTKVRKSHLLRALVIVIPAIILIWCANYFDFWWFTILVGITLGTLLMHVRAALALSLLAGGLGWGGGLIYQSFFLPITQTASLTAGIMGLSSADGWIVLVATPLLGVLLCVSGTWLSIALKPFVRACLQKREQR